MSQQNPLGGKVSLRHTNCSSTDLIKNLTVIVVFTFGQGALFKYIISKYVLSTIILVFHLVEIKPVQYNGFESHHFSTSMWTFAGYACSVCMISQSLLFIMLYQNFCHLSITFQTISQDPSVSCSVCAVQVIESLVSILNLLRCFPFMSSSPGNQCIVTCLFVL